MAYSGANSDVETALTRRTFMQVGGAAALGLALAGCGTSRNSSSAAGLTLGLKATIDNLNPLPQQGYQFTQMVGRQIWDPLVRFESDGSSVPMLAQSVAIDDTLTTTTVKIRKGVLFHDGTPMTVQDVAYSLGVRMDPKLVTLVGAIAVLPAEKFGSIESVDEQTVVIRTKSPFRLPEILRSIGIVPKDLHKRGDVATKPVGTGPFKLARYTAGSRIDLEMNTSYWDGAPHLKTLSFVLMKDISSQATALRSGDVDGLIDVSLVNLGQVEGVGNTKRFDGGQYLSWWVPQMGKGPLKDVRVRRALRYCFNREQMNASAYAKLGIDSWNPFKSTPYNDGRDLTDVTYDPGKAKELLAEAGATDIEVPILGIDSYEDASRIAQILIEGFREAGVRSSYTPRPFNDWLDALYTKANWDGLAFNAGTMPFPQSVLFAYLTEPAARATGGATKVAYPDAVKILDSYQAVSDAEVTQMMKAGQDLVLDDAISFPNFVGPVSNILPKNIRGVGTNRFGDLWLHKATLS